MDIKISAIGSVVSLLLSLVLLVVMIMMASGGGIVDPEAVVFEAENASAGNNTMMVECGLPAINLVLSLFISLTWFLLAMLDMGYCCCLSTVKEGVMKGALMSKQLFYKIPLLVISIILLLLIAYQKYAMESTDGFWSPAMKTTPGLLQMITSLLAVLGAGVSVWFTIKKDKFDHKAIVEMTMG